MRSKRKLFRGVALTLVLCHILMLILPNAVWAQAPCTYDRKAPSVDNARMNFKALNYKCAEQELVDYLKQDNLTLEQKSNAHILLATVYYAMLKDDSEKRDKVMEQFKSAFKAYREWRGELDIKSSEFMDLMNEAKVEVDKESAEKVAEKQPAADTSKQVTTITEGKEGGKPWYTKWWAIVLGVGVVGGAVAVLAGGGGGDTGTPATVDTLPSFPPHPTK